MQHSCSKGIHSVTRVITGQLSFAEFKCCEYLRRLGPMVSAQSPRNPAVTSPGAIFLRFRNYISVWSKGKYLPSSVHGNLF